MKDRFKTIVFIAVIASSLIFASTFDWSATGWNDGDLSGSYTDVDGSGINISVTVTGNTDNFIYSTPKLDDDNGNLNNDHLLEIPDFDDNTQSVTTIFKFSVPVKLSSLIWRDVDAMDDGTYLFDDKIIISAKDTNGNTIYPNNPQLGSNIQNDGNGAYEAKNNNQNYSPTDSEATFSVDINSTYVTEFSYTYTSGDGVGNNDDPTKQATWFDNFNFEPKDTDGDGVPDFKDLDDDNDGILDAVEMQGGGNCVYGFFHVIKGQLYLLDPENRVYNPIGADHGAIKYNGMGFDTSTGKLYAVARADGSDDYGNSLSKYDVIEIDRYSGKVRKSQVGGNINTYAADFYNGNLYARTATKKITVWSKADGSTSTISLNGRAKWADFAILPDSNGTPYAYGLYSNDTTSGQNDNTYLYRVNLSDGTVSRVSLTVTTPDGGDLSKAWGGTFIGKEGGSYHFYAANNNGYIYEITNFVSGIPAAEIFYQTGVTGNNDGSSCRDANQYAVDTDGDGIPDYLDLDSDNDGIPDNIEAQSTADYTAPSGTDADGDGLDDAYDQNTGGVSNSMGLIPPDTDGDNYADFVDNDSDNDGYGDCEEGEDPNQVNLSCSADGKTATGTIQNNGLVDWAGSDGYSDVNGNVDEPDPDKNGQLQDEVKNNDEAAYREFLCGKALITLTAYNWRMISLPCNTGSNTVSDIFGPSLGNYGDDADFVVYEQTGADNYEVNSSHTNTQKRMLAATDTLSQGKSYWIITDADHSVTIPKTLSGLTPTSTKNADDSTIGISDPDFTKVHQSSLPDNLVTQSGNDKKYMAGNVFPFAFNLRDLYFSHGGGSGSYYPMGDSNNDNYIESTVYTHDSNETGPSTGYIALDPATPGFDQGSIRPMEGFFIKLLGSTSDQSSNAFAYPLNQSNKL